MLGDLILYHKGSGHWLVEIGSFAAGVGCSVVEAGFVEAGVQLNRAQREVVLGLRQERRLFQQLCSTGHWMGRASFCG